MSLKTFEMFHDIYLFMSEEKINGYKETILFERGIYSTLYQKSLEGKLSKDPRSPILIWNRIGYWKLYANLKEFASKESISIQEYKNHIVFDFMKWGKYDAILDQQWLWHYNVHIYLEAISSIFHKGKKY